MPANDTKAALLKAARSEFAAYGVAGARVDRIAERAGVNKERIYGYFGSKEKLFNTVVAEALEEFTMLVELPSTDPGDYAGQVFDYHQRNPELLRLILWEGLHYRNDELPTEVPRTEYYRAKLENLARKWGREPTAELGRRLLLMYGISAWPSAVPQVRRMLTGEQPGDPEANARMRAQVVAFARAAAAGFDMQETGDAPQRDT